MTSVLPAIAAAYETKSARQIILALLAAEPDVSTVVSYARRRFHARPDIMSLLSSRQLYALASAASAHRQSSVDPSFVLTVLVHRLSSPPPATADRGTLSVDRALMSYLCHQLLSDDHNPRRWDSLLLNQHDAAAALGWSRGTVARSLDRLVNRLWVTHQSSRPGGSRRVSLRPIPARSRAALERRAGPWLHAVLEGTQVSRTLLAAPWHPAIAYGIDSPRLVLPAWHLCVLLDARADPSQHFTVSTLRRARGMLRDLDGLHLFTDTAVLDGLAEATGADGRAAAAWQERDEQKQARREEVENARHRGNVVRQIVATVTPPRARESDPEALREYMTEVRGQFAGLLETDPALEARVRREMRRRLVRNGWESAA
ncbi:hypothetical protein [Kocuria sp. KRD140]|uniref:hypothetical protein n=1 Tax=Kocuria sp. KRD140 TaxID=2729723 RepID=UPI0019D00392|nr:hypothetical protein [Kocuria sp. KRD140]